MGVHVQRKNHNVYLRFIQLTGGRRFVLDFGEIYRLSLVRIRKLAETRPVGSVPNEQEAPSLLLGFQPTSSFSLRSLRALREMRFISGLMRVFSWFRFCCSLMFTANLREKVMKNCVGNISENTPFV